MFYIIGNVHRGVGFTWVVERLPRDVWKYSRHGVFDDMETATIESERLNDKHDK